MRVKQTAALWDSGDEQQGCPPWCEGEHLGGAGDPGGFHHDGPTTIITVEHPVSQRRGERLLVNVSLQVQDHETGHRPYVEVQDSSETLALLMPVECLALARALLEAAAVLADADQLEHIRRKRLVQEIEDVINNGWIPRVQASGTS
jgi:hypothetical protein